MGRYALPIGIFAVIGLLLGLVFFGASTTVNYSNGRATAQPIGAEWVRGNPTARVVVIEYSDFQCPACALYEPIAQQLTKDFGDQIAFVYRHYPLYQIHANGDLAALVSEAAGLQGKFWQMHDLLFARQSQWDKAVGPMTYFDAYAKELQLDIATFDADVASDAVQQFVADDYARGQQVGVNSTPTFLINGTILKPNPAGYEPFKQLIEEALKR